ncbi:hypothetical protein MTP99_004309 [Tenebrio molitor]|nr:hypothetical protein MTP99_004309 [Tenebrio molitor]
MANSVMERICEQRKRDGFPALAIQWSAIGEVGMVAQLQKSYKGKEIFGTIPQPISTCLEALDNFLNQDNTIVSSTIIAEKRKKDDVSGDVLEVVANVLGINDVTRVSHYATLRSWEWIITSQVVNS